MTLSEIITKRIRALCKERRIRLSHLAEMSNLNTSTLDNIVNGRSSDPRLGTLMKIANAFNMTISEFLNFPDLDNYYPDDVPDED